MQIAAGAAGHIYEPARDRPRIQTPSSANQSQHTDTDGAGLEAFLEIKEIQAFPGEMSAAVIPSSLASALWAVKVKQSEKERGAIV